MDQAEEVRAMATESARQIRNHLAKHGDALTAEQRAKHEATAERMEAEAATVRMGEP